MVVGHERKITTHLSSQHNCSWHKWYVGVLLEAIVERDDVKDVEQLAFILMDSLDLDVKHGIWINDHVLCLLQIRNQLQLVLLIYNELKHLIQHHTLLTLLILGQYKILVYRLNTYTQ